MKPAPPVMSARIPAIRLERTKQTWRLLRRQRRRATDTSEAIALPDRLPLPSDTLSDPDPAMRPVREWESGSAPAFRFLGCATVAARRLWPRSAPQTNGRRDRDPAPEARERARRTERGDTLRRVGVVRLSSPRETAGARSGSPPPSR